MAEEENEEKISPIEKIVALSPIPIVGERAMYKWKMYNTHYSGDEAKRDALMGTFFSRTFIYIATAYLCSL